MPEELAPPPGIPDETTTPPGSVAVTTDTPPKAAPAEPPARLYAGKYRTPEEMEAAYEAAQREMHEATTRAAEAERRAATAQQQQQQPPPPPPSEPEDADAKRWKAVTPYYQQKLAFYTNAYKDIYDGEQLAQLAQQAAVIDAQGLFEARRHAEEEALASAQAAYERAAQEFRPYIARQQSEQALAGLGLTGVTLAEVETDIRTALGIAPEALAGVPEENRRALLAAFAKSRAYDARATATRPAPPAKPPPTAAVTAGPRQDGPAPSPPPDAAVEAKFRAIRASLSPLVPDEVVRAIAQDAVTEEGRVRRG